MSFDWSKLGSLSVPLNVAAPSTATSGVVDNSVTNNEAHTGAFTVGSGTATDTTSGPTQTGGTVPNSNFGQPPSYVSGMGGAQGVQVTSMLANPAAALLIAAALFVIFRRGKI